MQHFNPLEPMADGKPPAEVHVTSLRAEPWPDGRRIRVLVTVTPFLERPDVTAFIYDSAGEEVSTVNIVETMDVRMAFTMHIRSPQVSGRYTLTAALSYEAAGEVDRQSIEFETQEIE
jgi:hypothetical protein